MLSKEEKLLLNEGPYWVHAALTAADGRAGSIARNKEWRTFLDELKNYQTNSAIVKEVQANEENLYATVRNASLDEAVAKVDQINDLLDDKMDKSDAQAYRGLLIDIGEKIAGAVGEGFLGRGPKISDDEQKALDGIRAALKPEARVSRVRPSRVAPASVAGDAMAAIADQRAKAAEAAEKASELAAKRKEEAQARMEARKEREEKEGAEAIAAAAAEKERIRQEQVRARIEAQTARDAAEAKVAAEAKAAEAAAAATAAAKVAEEARAAEARAKAVAAKAKDTGYYVVRSGDSLSKISLEVYGNAGRWKEIFEANKDIVSNPNLIYPGQKLRIP